MLRASRCVRAAARAAGSGPPKLRGASGRLWETVVGLEIHAQIASKSKLFSRSSTSFSLDRPNAHVSLFDAATPGALPVLNRECVMQAARTGLALQGEVQRVSQFERKHYFYADLPSGFQITQQRRPLVVGGHVDVELDEGGEADGGGAARRVRIARVQLEQDSGKSVHDLDPWRSLVDLNRAGVALMEIVTEPDLRSGA